MQQLTGKEGSPALVQLMAADVAFQGACAATLGLAYVAVLDVANIVDRLTECSTQGTLQSLPGACELLLCPELVPCLAITVLVLVLGFDTCALALWPGGKEPAASLGGATSGAGSSSDAPASTRQGALQQGRAPCSNQLPLLQVAV
jgi:hypothetical protein